MTQYMIAFDDGDMIIPEEELPDVAKAVQEVVQEARKAGCGSSALEWAAKLAVACRCTQQVFELLPDPTR